MTFGLVYWGIAVLYGVAFDYETGKKRWLTGLAFAGIGLGFFLAGTLSMVNA